MEYHCFVFTELDLFWRCAFERVCLCSWYVFACACACAFVFIMEPYCAAVFSGCESDVLGLALDNSSMMLTSAASLM